LASNPKTSEPEDCSFIEVYRQNQMWKQHTYPLLRSAHQLGEHFESNAETACGTTRSFLYDPSNGMSSRIFIRQSPILI
jgi:hypothetical protein